MPGIKEQWEAAPLWQRLLIVIIFPAVVIGAIWFYVINPDTERKEKLLSEKKQLTQEIERYRRMIKPQILENLKRKIDELKKKEEEKRRELEKVVGKIPTQEEIEQVFGEINRIAIEKNLIITRIRLSQPKTRNLQLVEKDGRKFVRVVAQEERSSRRRRQKRRTGTVKKVGVPVTTMEIAMSLEGRTKDVYAFLNSIYEKGLVSYPKSIKIRAGKGGRAVSADIVIDVILQK